ncbi:hypothetical protein CcaCcLH18_12108 [Colletotrichum camelliae]|nr:hypothetical protein CcaCcLH18_12108 [Colletotrichum camelliae]
MVSYNEALLATPASRVVNPYIQGADIMDTGVPYCRERGFSAPPPSNSAAAEDDHQRAEMAPRLPPLRELLPEIYEGNKTARAEVADMGPFDTAGREQRQSSPYRMNGSTLGAAATETPFAPRPNAVGHVHDAPPAPVHPEHEREPRNFYDECQISRFPFDKPSNTFGDRGTSHVRGKDTQSYPSQDIRSYFSPRSKQDYVPIQNSQSYHHLHDDHSYYPHEQQYGYHHGYMQGSVSRQAQYDNGHPQDHAPVDHHACDHHESSVSHNTHGWTPINARDSRPVLTPDRTPFADRYHQESPTPAARGRKVPNDKRSAQGNTERYVQPAPKLKLKGARSKKSTPQSTTKYREIQPKPDFKPKAVVVSSNKSQTPRLDALANSAAAPAKPAGKRAATAAGAPLHETWTPAPTNTTKCDVCNSRAIGPTVHQRCTECPYVICRNCVYDGKMTKLRNHKPIHVDEFNWGKMRPIQRMDKVRAAQQARARLDGGESDNADYSVGSKKQSTKSAAPFTPTKKASQTYVTISDDDYDDNDLHAPEDDYKPPTSSERKSKKATKAADQGFSALDQYAGHVGLANSRPVRTSSINTYERMRHQATARQQIAQPDFGAFHAHGTDARKRYHDDSDDEDFEPDDVVYNPRGKRRFM